jgi:hypothetical protein
MLPKPLVVWAIQSPTILNRLARSQAWRLRVADLGDSTGFRERELLACRQYDAGDGDPNFVFVCSMMQLQTARHRFPRATMVFVAHQGYPFRIMHLLKEVSCIATFCSSHADVYQDLLPLHRSRALIPVFVPEPTWQWSPETLWTVLSRPGGRHPMASAGVHEILYLMAEARPKQRPSHVWYGQDQPGGFLDEAGISAKKSRCSAYLTMLPPKSGIGLVEHECMAAGVPIVGARWADLLRLGDVRSLHDYFSFERIREECFELCDSEAYARSVSEDGLQYVSERFSQRAMDQSIEVAMAKWGSA